MPHKATTNGVSLGVKWGSSPESCFTIHGNLIISVFMRLQIRRLCLYGHDPTVQFVVKLRLWLHVVDAERSSHFYSKRYHKMTSVVLVCAKLVTQTHYESDVPWRWMLTMFTPDGKVHDAYVGPIWGRQDPDGPHVGDVNLAIWGTVMWLVVGFIILIWSIKCKVKRYDLLLYIRM